MSDMYGWSGDNRFLCTSNLFFCRREEGIYLQHFLKKTLLVLFFLAFAKLRKAAISFVMSVCLHDTTRFPLDGFSCKLIFDYLIFDYLLTYSMEQSPS